MSAGIPPPPPPSPLPPPPPLQSTQQYLRQRWSKHFKSSKESTQIEEPSKKSFIWDWLEGKLENKTANFSSQGIKTEEFVPPPQHQVYGSSMYENEEYSPQVSVIGPVLAPVPLQAIQPQIVPIMSESPEDQTMSLVSVYDPSTDSLLYMSLTEYVNLFGAPPPVSTRVQNFNDHIYNLFGPPTLAQPSFENNFKEFESDCIDVIQTKFPLEENVPYATSKEIVEEDQKLPDEENKFEQKEKKEVITYVRRSKMKPIKTIQIGDINVDVPLKKKLENANENHVWTNIEDEAVNYKKKNYEVSIKVKEDAQIKGGFGENEKKNMKIKKRNNKGKKK